MVRRSSLAVLLLTTATGVVLVLDYDLVLPPTSSVATSMASAETQITKAFQADDSAIPLLLRNSKTAFFGADGKNVVSAAGVTTVPNTFPTAVTGYMVMPLKGGTAFALGGQCELRSSGSCIGAELDTRNFAGSPPPAAPGNWSSGTSDRISVALHLGAGGHYESGIGLSVGPDGGDLSRFVTGIYTWSVGVSQTGILIDADAHHGPVNSAVFRSRGLPGDTNVLLQTMNSASGPHRVVEHRNSNGQETFTIDSDGKAHFRSMQGDLSTPTSSSARCEPGEFSDDASYHYVCVAKSKWKRVELKEF